MKLVCEFVGGRMNGISVEETVAGLFTTKRSRDWSKERAQGGCVPRAELDNKPVFDNYFGPMWDGLRYTIDGIAYYEHDLKYKPELKARVEAEKIEPYGVLRYETQEVYDLLSR